MPLHRCKHRLVTSLPVPFTYIGMVAIWPVATARSPASPQTQYPADATVEIDGTRYTIVGNGGAAGEKAAGEEWNWRWQVTEEGVQQPVTPPETLYGWQTALDNLLTGIATQDVSNTESLSVREYFAECGQSVTIAGEIAGEYISGCPVG